MNSDDSSIASTWMPCCEPSSLSAAIPSSIDECRKPAVLENTRIRKRALGSRAIGITLTTNVRVAEPPNGSRTITRGK